MSEHDDEYEIDQSMRQIYHAFLAHDVAALDRAFAPEFTFSDPSGPVVSKEQWLQDIASGNLVFDAIDVKPAELRHLGDRVVVSGEATIRARYTKSDYSGTFRYLGVYMKRGDAWKLELTSAERLDPARG